MVGKSQVNEIKAAHELLALPNGEYKVNSFKLKQTHTLPSIEGAAEVLKMVGVPDDEIDAAIIDMALRGNNYAQFGVDKGIFIFSDKVKLA